VSDFTLPTSPLLNAVQAAHYLQVTERALEDWRFRRVGPAYVRVGRQVRYDIRALDAWLLANTVSAEVA
jgi:hypothetical protein